MISRILDAIRAFVHQRQQWRQDMQAEHDASIAETQRLRANQVEAAYLRKRFEGATND